METTNAVPQAYVTYQQLLAKIIQDLPKDSFFTNSNMLNIFLAIVAITLFIFVLRMANRVYGVWAAKMIGKEMVIKAGYPVKYATEPFEQPGLPEIAKSPAAGDAPPQATA